MVQGAPYQQVCKYSEYLLIHCNWIMGIFGVLIVGADYTDLLQFVHFTSLRNYLAITNLLFLHFMSNIERYFALHRHYFSTIGRLSVTEAHTKSYAEELRYFGIVRWWITCIA